MTDVPKAHPRYVSLRTRDDIVAGVERGVTSIHGLIAHGRGEAFDYLLGERSHPFAIAAIEAAAAMLLSAAHPVISVNGNAAALVASEMVALGRAIGAPLEVNIFHGSKAREEALLGFMSEHGACEVLMPDPGTELEFIHSNRRFVNPRGIFKADLVFVPLEDGDRCQALVKAGKRVVTVDLNPMSRTSRTATVTIVDNVGRAMPLLLEEVERLRGDDTGIAGVLERFDNGAVLAQAERAIRGGA